MRCTGSVRDNIAGADAGMCEQWCCRRQVEDCRRARRWPLQDGSQGECVMCQGSNTARACSVCCDTACVCAGTKSAFFTDFVLVHHQLQFVRASSYTQYQTQYTAEI